EENFQHVEGVLRVRQAQIVAHEPIEWTSSRGNGLTAFALGKTLDHGLQLPLVAELAPPADATELIVRWRWLAAKEAGQFIRASFERQQANGQWQREAETLVGPRIGSQESAAMFHVANRSSRIRLV